ncbi:hypothetical protein EVAR_9875_1 [Eumeta japonica]|uniref:Uncharacterized protein n=1 Tax=Eumeta variegata TaxID=151549 RepID=A0A4C1TQG6_EUMVA|nr:hypothetical protein EVAR_9875_1 [Eumeta japonica]
MFTVTLPTKEQIDNSFKRDILHLNTIALVNPSPEDIEALCKTYGHLTNLKRTEVEYQLKRHNWDIIQALQTFSDDLKSDKIPLYLFKNQHTEDISDYELKWLEEMHWTFGTPLKATGGIYWEDIKLDPEAECLCACGQCMEEVWTDI